MSTISGRAKDYYQRMNSLWQKQPEGVFLEEVERQKRVARLIAFYLPQYHPISENDEWWGRGFTEWTNVAKAKPLYRGHYQPHIPADLGFYDLRVPEVRIAQAEMAEAYGIEGFCYYHYWFAGKRLLERPFNEVLASGEPDFPFCLCWANDTWTGIWHGAPNRTLIEQTYPGREDYENHFRALLPAFADHRYMTVEGKPLFVVYLPEDLPGPERTTDLWRELALKAGLKGLWLVGIQHQLDSKREAFVPTEHGFDASSPHNLGMPELTRRSLGLLRPRVVGRLWRRLFGYPTYFCLYEEAIKYLVFPGASKGNVYPCLIPNWDNTPRSGRMGRVLHKSTPSLFRIHIRETLQQIMHKPTDHRIVFIKSWNEWAEGNHLEPDILFGTKYLEAIKEENSFKRAAQV